MCTPTSCSSARVFEPLALAIAEPVDAARLIEDAQRQPRDLLRVLGPVAAALAELDDAAAPDVGIALDLADPRACCGGCSRAPALRAARDRTA